MTHTTRHLLGIGGSAVFTLIIYLANDLSPPQIKLALLYLVPVLIATWYEGIWWGVGFTLVSMALRLVIELEQQPGTTVALSLVNQLAFAALAGIAMMTFRNLRRTQEQLALLATHDLLTDVLNARAFAERLTRELERTRRYARPLALIYLDLDDFKVVNDTHGHQTGDAVLRLVADAMRSSVRQADVVGRLGGDEFAVLMPETDAQVADTAAQRLATGLRTVFKGTPTVTASIGVVSCTDKEATTDDLLRRADQAMYEAKRTGKDRVVQVAI
ncbi:MAG TPA: GGDEF domain-containing protein [Gemmatimonadales bacterium]|jgi:diguanylate cyclase (GGDEF)-like protein|nr:GGDEF domain-containing protein [Gemmatimonadales bacterium]